MSAAQNESLPQSQGTPIRSRVCPDINPMNGGVVDNSQAGNTMPTSSDPATKPRKSRSFFRSLLGRSTSR